MLGQNSLLFISAAFLALGSATTRAQAFDRCLQPKLSSGASISHVSSAAPRWSEYDAPRPGTVVLVATEQDVSETMKCLNAQNLTFLVQAGGNGWSTTPNIGSKDVTINLRRLNRVTFNSAKTEVTVQGGTIISELVSTAYANNAQVMSGNCNCVGVFGALTGGGYGRLMGKAGLAIDNLLSLTFVDASAQIRRITASSDPDLWFALRGSGPNFGIITSATLRSTPTPREQNGAWSDVIAFSPEKLERLVQTINDLRLEPEMTIFLAYSTSGAPTYTPGVAALAFYAGQAAAAERAFGPIYALGPVSNMSAYVPYNQINDATAVLCAPGGRKPSYGAASASMVPATWRSVFTKFSNFVQRYGGERVGNSSVIMEAYSLDKAKSFGDASSSYAWRSLNKFNSIAFVTYSDPALDSAGEAFGRDVRATIQQTGGLSGNPVYSNFAFGDESLSQIYGPNVQRLQQLKRRFDPRNRFNQWFPLI